MDIITIFCQPSFQVKRELTVKRGGKELFLSKLLLNADFIPTDVGKAGPELIACQVGKMENVTKYLYLQSNMLTWSPPLRDHLS